jgi:hypothetical protein
MAWRIGLAALLLLWSAAAAARHGSGVLEPSRATPGIRLELVELPPASLGRAKYRLRAEGMPRGVTFDVWTKDFGQQFTEAFSGFRMDEAGMLMSVDGTGRPRRLEGLALDPGPYPKGAVWMVALASDDHKLSAFAKVIPYPIAARDGTCVVSLELVSLFGYRFLASGFGFGPGEEVQVESRALGRVTPRKLRVSPGGLLPPDVISHGGISADRGARYTVKARSCEVSIEYDWGEPALIRR